MYGRTSLGAPKVKKRQETLTQIGFVHPTPDIDAEIEECEREEQERAKRRKTGQKAKPLKGTKEHGTQMQKLIELRAEGKRTEVRDADDEDEDDLMPNDNEGMMIQQEDNVAEVPAPILQDRRHISLVKPKATKRRKPKQGIQIGVRLVKIKVESPEPQAQSMRAKTPETQIKAERNTQAMNRLEDSEVDVIKDSFAMPQADSIEGDDARTARLFEQRRQEAKAKQRRDRVVADSDVESEDEDVVHDSIETDNEDIDIVLDSEEEAFEKQYGVDRIGREPIGFAHPDEREIPDSNADSDSDLDMPEEQEEPGVVHDSQQRLPATYPVIIPDSFYGDGLAEAKRGQALVKDSFIGVAQESQLEVVQDSFHTALPTLQEEPRLPPSQPEVGFVPSISPAKAPKQPTMPPPKTPTKVRRMEIPNTNSTCSSISTCSTIRTMTPSPTKAAMYNRSPLKRLSENLAPLSLSLPRLTQPPRKSQSQRPRESQISTQGTPTQHSIRPSRKPISAAEDVGLDDEGAILSDSSPRAPRPVSPHLLPSDDNRDTQHSTYTNSPSKQIHSELSAASDRLKAASSSTRTVRFRTFKDRTEVKDTQDSSEEELLTQPTQQPSQSSFQLSAPRRLDATAAVDYVQTSEPEPEQEQVPSSQQSTDNRSQSIRKPDQSTQGSVCSLGRERPPVVGGDSQWMDKLMTDGDAGASISTEPVDSQWPGGLLTESLMVDGLSVPPQIDDESWED